MNALLEWSSLLLAGISAVKSTDWTNRGELELKVAELEVSKTVKSNNYRAVARKGGETLS